MDMKRFKELLERGVTSREANYPDWNAVNVKLANIIKNLRRHDDQMKQVFDEYVFDLLSIDRGRLLDKKAPYLRWLFFFALHTKPQATLDGVKRSMEHFNKNQDRLIENLNAQSRAEDKFQDVCKIVYTTPGVGQKVGSLFLELLTLYGWQNPELLPYLYVPIDGNVYRVLSRSELPNNIVPNPERQITIHQRKFREFQERLKRIAEANGSYRIHFDYLWYVGHRFCRESSNDCENCWLESICRSA